MLRHHHRPSLPSYRSDPEFTKASGSKRSLSRLSYFWRIKPLTRYPILLIILGLLWFFYRWEFHVKIMLYSLSSIHQEITKIEPLSGCFSPGHLNADGNQYNLTRARAPKKYEVQAGIQLRHDMDCYHLAGTIPSPSPSLHISPSLPRSERTNYHTYWRSDLVHYGERQEWMLKSFFGTQNIRESTLILWSNDASVLKTQPRIAIYLAAYP